LELDAVALVDATGVAPSPTIPGITSNFAERLQLMHAANWFQLVHSFILDIV
jgi:hypothetical protein